MPFDVRQLLAARALLDWTQAQLADAASIRFGTVRDFEGEQQKGREAKLLKMRHAFEEAGIVFENNGKFVGLRVKAKRGNTGQQN